MQSISKTPLQHCMCLPSLPHLPSLPGLAGQTAGKKSEKLLHHMSQSHGRRATPWREHKAILQWLFILIKQSFEHELNFKWLKARSSHDLYNFCQQMIAGCILHRSLATWSSLHPCLITTSDHTIIETFWGELIVFYILFDSSLIETVLAVDSYVSMTPSYLCMCKFETCGEFLIYEDWRFGSELGAIVELWNCTKWPRQRIFGQMCSVYYSQPRWSSLCNCLCQIPKVKTLSADKIK